MQKEQPAESEGRRRRYPAGDQQGLLPFHRPNELGTSSNTVSDSLELGNQSFSTLAALIYRLEDALKRDTDVIGWASPVPSFGNFWRAKFATVGLNPSNREFVDELGEELEGESRRFHTLASLGLESWLDADVRHLRLIAGSCGGYFSGNPYDAWFRPLDRLIAGVQGTFYGETANSCHLDLIPFATARKWTDLSNRQRAELLGVASDTLALLLRDSLVQMIILNGRTVVEQFQAMARIRLREVAIPESTLRRQNGRDVLGMGFCGLIDSLSGIRLNRELLVVGYNHNLQSSFGVTRTATAAIREWIQRIAAEHVR